MDAKGAKQLEKAIKLKAAMTPEAVDAVAELGEGELRGQVLDSLQMLAREVGVRPPSAETGEVLRKLCVADRDARKTTTGPFAGL